MNRARPTEVRITTSRRPVVLQADVLDHKRLVTSCRTAALHRCFPLFVYVQAFWNAKTLSLLPLWARVGVMGYDAIVGPKPSP